MPCKEIIIMLLFHSFKYRHLETKVKIQIITKKKLNVAMIIAIKSVMMNILGALSLAILFLSFLCLSDNTKYNFISSFFHTVLHYFYFPMSLLHLGKYYFIFCVICHHMEILSLNHFSIVENVDKNFGKNMYL